MKKFGLIFIVFIALVIVMAGTVEYRARGELAAARAAGEDFEAAITHYSRCLNWYVPGGAFGQAAEELLALGEKYISQGREADARLALMRLCAGLNGAASFSIPRRDLLENAQPLLANLLARQRLDPSASEADIQRQAAIYLDLMTRPAPPAKVPAAAASLGFILWAISGIGFALKFFSARPGRKATWLWAGCFVLGYAAWLWGMSAA